MYRILFINKIFYNPLCVKPPPLVSAVHGDTRIIGGSEVLPYSVKYQASILYLNSHFCGGALIQPQWVASAAHCWRP